MDDRSEASEFESLLEYLAVVAESWKLVLCGTFVFAGLAAAVIWLWKEPVYQSNAILLVPAQIEAILKSGRVLDPVAVDVGYLARYGNLTEARESLANRIGVSPEAVKGTDIRTVSVQESAPARAQAILARLLAEFIAQSKPIGASREAALQTIAALEKAVVELRALAGRLTAKEAIVPNGGDGERYARAVSVLISDIVDKEAKIRDLRRSLEGLRTEDIAQSPSLPSRPVSGRGLHFLGLTALGFAAMVFLVLVRDLLKRASSENSIAVDRVKRAFTSVRKQRIGQARQVL